MRKRITCTLLVAVLVQLGFFTYPVAAYVRPIDASVVDAFREPTSKYGAGNRGWEYNVPSGLIVRAAADGVVSYSGRINNVLVIVVTHAENLRTTYLGVAEVTVSRGSTVREGQVIARTAGGRTYFGLRRGDVYVDPASLFGASHAVLVENEQSTDMSLRRQGEPASKDLESSIQRPNAQVVGKGKVFAQIPMLKIRTALPLWRQMPVVRALTEHASLSRAYLFGDRCSATNRLKFFGPEKSFGTRLSRDERVSVRRGSRV